MKNKSSSGQILVAALILLAGAVGTMGQVPQLLNYQGRIAVNGTNFTGTGQFKFALISASTNASTQATATATVAYGFLVNITVVNGGSGYSVPPTVSITDGSGAGAAAYAQIAGGVVTNIVVTSAGSGYSGSPSITLAAPPQQNVASTFWSNDGTSNSGGQPASSVPLLVTKGLYSVLLGDTTLSNMNPLPASVFANPNVFLRVWFNDGGTGFQQFTPDQRLAAVGYAIMAGSVPDGSITAGKIAAGAVGSSQLAPNLTIPGTLTVSNLVVNGAATISTATNFQVSGGALLQTHAGGYYFITNTETSILLPAYANVGDAVHLRIASANGDFTYYIRQNPGQRIVRWESMGWPKTICSSGDGVTLAVADSWGLGFFLSTNSAISWTANPYFNGTFPSYPSGNNNNSAALSVSLDGSHIYSGCRDDDTGKGYIMCSKDYGQSWLLNTNLPFSNFIFSGLTCSSNGSYSVASGYFNNSAGGVFTSSDSGSNWVLQAGASSALSWGSVACSVNGGRIIACTGVNGGPRNIYLSSDFGTNWSVQATLPTGAYWNSVSISSDGSKLAAACKWNGQYGGVYVSTNSGSAWKLQTAIPTNASWNAVTISADGTKLAASSSDLIYTTLDMGGSWTIQTNGLAIPVNCSSLATTSNGQRLFATSGTNMYSSANFGTMWDKINTYPQVPFSTPIAISSVGTNGGAKFYSLGEGELVLVYVGNGMFACSYNNYLYGY